MGDASLDKYKPKMIAKKDIHGKTLWWFHFICLGFLLVWIIWHLYQFDMTNHGYILGDWLINYEDGGFKRRGLSGSFFFLLQDFTGIRLQYLVMAFQSLAYMAFFSVLLLIIRDRFLDLAFLILLWSPVTLFCYVQEPTIIGRKEILVFLVFALYALRLIKYGDGKFKHWPYYLSLCMTTLLHEVALFYIPYFILLRRLHIKGEGILSRENLGFLISVFMPVAAIKLWGGGSQQRRILRDT